MSDRWDAFTHEECMNIHHALRMLTTHPLVSEGERKKYAALADEIWDRHARQVEMELR